MFAPLEFSAPEVIPVLGDSAPAKTMKGVKTRSHESSTKQQKESLVAMTELVQLRLRQAEVEQELQTYLKQMRTHIQACIRNAQVGFQRLALQVRTYVACLVYTRGRGGVFIVRIMSITAEEMTAPREGTIAAYVPTLDYRETEEHLRKWAREHEVKRRNVRYTLTSTQLDEFLVTPANIGYEETMYWITV